MAEKKTTAKKAVKKSEALESKPAKERKPKVQLSPPAGGGHGKKYLAVLPKVDKNKFYPVAEVIQLVKETSPVKFDATAELHLQMGLDPKKSEQNIRGTVTLPAGTGKQPKILVLAEATDTKKAEAAGADFVGLEDMIEKIQKGWLGFDVVIATPAVMPQLGKLGQTLGTKGLMPNPKSGTVTTDVAKAVEEFKKGKVEFRLDKDAIIHMGFGKVSFAAEDLQANLNAILGAVRAAKPSSAKGTYIKKLSLSSTMGPGIKIDLNSV
ncbi:TPA: 50S ribosomal protein L1 [Patescibacteria group bacterium]|uniref:Large ribosomal subunit protein uL1 n=2 Tax=Bacteria division Kazan-3B-28 TaxID=1798534 RepID=A0A0G1ZGB5_UNCK3|nr:MAG: 50S ribosomal protein L1, large subunit ribosomal protein L1 [candidate division Kazan bacterium GW2011_GWA1_50_15]KKW26942.1 MAG: 50S ribosomal protein L1 [candidate division Kazan bacterium GW2011_GWB1_52_7]HAV66068.1 50S ribosomal protein L1 [Patescibacteria group bacterium]HCL47511.1 50S ribosomal protein L1 [Patescibacteria group bacterium]HCR42606.1 50S ribosomal protein L1 [Patescibacteria group bacterium]